MRTSLPAAEFKEMRPKVTMSVVRQILKDSESRSGNIPMVWASIVEYVKENWVDILKLLIMIISMVAQENDE